MMLKQRDNPVDNAREVFNQKANDKRDKRNHNIQYLHLVVKSLAAFIFGLLLGYILKLC